MHSSRRLLIAGLFPLAACASSASSPTPAPTVAAPSAQPSPATKLAEPPAVALKAPGDATIGDRTRCPTSGEEFTVTASSPKVEYQGKTYYFCCGGCDSKFASDPGKYLSKKPGA